jgi:hypothetical protein
VRGRAETPDSVLGTIAAMTVAEARTLYGQIAEVGVVHVWFCV